MKKLLWTLVVLLFLFCVFLLIKLNTTRLGGGKTNEVTIANPASIYCEQQSWTLEIVTDSSGAQSWLCHLLDGTTCEERAYIRGECPVTETVEIAPGENIVQPTVSVTPTPVVTINYKWDVNACWWVSSEWKPNSSYFAAAKFVNQQLQDVRVTWQNLITTKINTLTAQLQETDGESRCTYAWAIDALQHQPGYVTSYSTTNGVTEILIDFVSYKETLEEIDFWPPEFFFQTKNTSKKARTYTLDTTPALQTLYTNEQWYVTMDQKKIYLNNLNQRLNQFCNNEKIYTQDEWTNINRNEQNVYCVQDRLSPSSNYWPSIIYFEFNAAWKISKIHLNWRRLSTAG